MFMRLSRMREVDDAMVREPARELLAGSGPLNAFAYRRRPHLAVRFLLDYFFQ